MRTTYEIHITQLQDLFRRLGKLSARSVRLGCVPLSFAEVGRTERGRRGTFVTIAIDNEPIHVNGWSFVGMINHTPEGNVIKSLPGVVLDVKYNDVKPWCDHCRVSRRRNDSFIVRHNGELGEKQVGSSCLADFTGHINPHTFAQAATILGAVNSACRAAAMEAAAMPEPQPCPVVTSPFVEDLRDIPTGYHRRSAHFYLDLRGYLAAVAHSIRTRGWFPRAHGEFATAENAYVAWADRASVTNLDVQIAEATIDWAENFAPQNEFDDAVKAIIGSGSGVCKRERIGYAAAATYQVMQAGVMLQTRVWIAGVHRQGNDTIVVFALDGFHMHHKQPGAKGIALACALRVGCWYELLGTIAWTRAGEMILKTFETLDLT